MLHWPNSWNASTSTLKTKKPSCEARLRHCTRYRNMKAIGTRCGLSLPAKVALLRLLLPTALRPKARPRSKNWQAGGSALGKSTHFFFVTANSLKSKMVSLEWQNAVLLSTKGKCKLVPVHCDQSWCSAFGLRVCLPSATRHRNEWALPARTHLTPGFADY